jgi:hypothetical protein
MRLKQIRVYPHFFLDRLDSFHSRGSVRISVFWVLSKLVKLLMQSFHYALYINYHQPMQYDLHCIPEIVTGANTIYIQDHLAGPSGSRATIPLFLTKLTSHLSEVACNIIYIPISERNLAISSPPPPAVPPQHNTQWELCSCLYGEHRSNAHSYIRLTT